jgi:spore cortex formation protein SpoVR/YcgB (stage V sporulation)
MNEIKRVEKDWDFDSLRRSYDAISDIAMRELKLDIYPNQIEVMQEFRARRNALPPWVAQPCL